jgi:transposase
MKRITDEQCEHIIGRYAEGLTVRDIASEEGVSKTTVINIIKESGRSMRHSRHTPPDKCTEAISMYKGSFSIREILERTGIKSEQTLYTILRDSGTPLRR